MPPSHAILILAAGQGTRMKSALPKVLHPLADKPMLAHILDAARALDPQRLIVVIGHGGEQVSAVLAAADVTWVTQEEQKGTGHAVACALPALTGLTGELLVLNGDVPLIQSDTLAALLQDHRERQRAATLLSMTLDDPFGYGRILRQADGDVVAVVEEKEADAATRAIREVNSGTWCLDLAHLPGWLARIGNQNSKGEFYLTDLIALARAKGLHTGALIHADAQELMGVNSRAQLAALEAVFRDRLVRRFMDQGVTFKDPGSCWLAADVVIGQDSVIGPGVILGPGVVIGGNCRIGPCCQITRSRLGDGVEVKAFSHVEGAELIGPNTIGPYTRLRPDTVLEPAVQVGNFCEIKKSHVGPGTKINHLSYVGDATVGAKVNIGAGTITCNYDGVHKHHTVIGDHVFVGSDTQFIAPVTVGEGALVGAGTTVTRDVPANALAVSRTPQKNVENWVRHKE